LLEVLRAVDVLVVLSLLFVGTAAATLLDLGALVSHYILV
jgi:hypothetical protein